MDTLVAIDPGSLAMGWAVFELLPIGENLIDYGVCRTRHLKSHPQRRHAMMRHIVDLLTLYQPRAIAYETYVYFSTRASGENDVTSAFKVHQIIGAILMGALYLPNPPEIIELLPQVWGRQLTGSQAHTKEAIAKAVNLRLGTHMYATDGGHHTDGVGLGLVGLDIWQHTQRVRAAEEAHKDQGRAHRRN